MKLSTMLLPTGEFILICSEVPRPHPSIELLSELKQATGAAAVLFVEQLIEAEDALIDENARRRDTPITTDVASIDESQFFTADGDSNLLKTLYGGGEFSPAGLVKSVGDRDLQEWASAGHLDIGGADPTIDAEHVDADEILAVGPRLESQNVTVADFDPHRWSYQIPGEFGRSPHTGPQDHDLNLDDLTVAGFGPEDEPWKPQVGDRVVITGPSYYASTRFKGETGVITVVPPARAITGQVPVQLDNWSKITGNVQLFPLSSVEPAQVDLEELVSNG